MFLTNDICTRTALGTPKCIQLRDYLALIARFCIYPGVYKILILKKLKIF